MESGDAKDLLKSLTQNLPMNPELMQLLNQTFRIDRGNGTQKKRPKPRNKSVKEPFKPQRYPSYLKLKTKNDGLKPVAQIPLGGERAIHFETDVEDHYFDRVKDPGDMRIALLGFSSNDGEGGDKPSRIEQIDDAFNVIRSSPHEGTIKVNFSPTKKVDVGDAVQIKATLNGAGQNFDEIFWVKVSGPEAPQPPSKKPKPSQEPDFGLPPYTLAYENQQDEKDTITWEKLGESSGVEMDYDTVMHPMVGGDQLERVYINMDSAVLKNFKSKTRNPNADQLELANRKYIFSVYLHTLFLYTITKNRNYKLSREEDNGGSEVDIGDYLKDLFGSHYAAFLLNFGTDGFMQLLDD